MILDIITAALIVIPMAIGMARGLAYIAVRAFGWVASLAISFFLNPLASGWLKKSPLGEMVYGELEERFAASADNVNSTVEGLPQIISGSVEAATNEAAEIMAKTIGGMVISIMAFVILVLLLRLIVLVLLKLTKKRGDGSIPVVSRVNKLAGLLVGGAEGLLLAFLFLAALIPVMNMASPETAASIADGLKYSHLAGPLYDGNFLLAIISNLTG